MTDATKQRIEAALRRYVIPPLLFIALLLVMGMTWMILGFPCPE